jgi:hypothetical protein
MARDVHCPNPGCTHVFPAAAMAGVAALVCPTCGGVFQIRRASSQKAEASATHQQRRPHGSTLARRRRTAWGWIVGGMIVLVSLVLMSATIYRQFRSTGPAASKPASSDDHNYSFDMPPEGPDELWQRDRDLAKQMGGVLAFRHARPDAAWFVLAVRNYPKYVPTLAELKEEAISRLRAIPLSNLQHEDKSTGASLAGRPAGRVVFQGMAREKINSGLFQGVVQDRLMSGDVLYLTHQGAAYWFYRLCPTNEVDSRAAELAELTERFALLDLHPDWQPPRRSFTGEKVKYTLTAEGDRWNVAQYPAANYDPAADLALVGQEREGVNEPARQALTLVVPLPPGDGEIMERAKAHLLERQKEIYEATTLADEPGDAKSGDGPAKLAALKVVNTKDRERFVVLGVVARPEGPIMVWAECDYARRPIWEAEFRKLVGSYKVESGPGGTP